MRLVEPAKPGKKAVIEIAPLPDGEFLWGRRVIWPGVRNERIEAELEYQFIETDEAVYYMYTPRLIQPEPPKKRKGLMRFAR